MIELRRNRVNTPVTPAIQLYDIGMQIFTNAGEFHTWDTIDFKTSDFHYTVDNDRVSINRPGAGFYEITFECSFSSEEAGFASMTSQIYLNGAAVVGSKARGCTYDSGQGHVACACLTLHFIIYLKAKDYVQIKTTSSNIDVLSGLETSRLTIKFVPTQGWNNNSGGNINYRGEVDR